MALLNDKELNIVSGGNALEDLINQDDTEIKLDNDYKYIDDNGDNNIGVTISKNI